MSYAILLHVLKHGGVDVAYHYTKHGEMPKHVSDFIPGSWDEVLVPMVIASSPALPAALNVILPELFGGRNPLFGPQGAFRTPTPSGIMKRGFGLMGLYYGAKFTMSPGATVSHGPFGSVSVMPSLGFMPSIF